MYSRFSPQSNYLAEWRSADILKRLDNGTVKCLSWYNTILLSQTKNPGTIKEEGIYCSSEHIAKMQLVRYHAKSLNSLSCFLRQCQPTKEQNSKIEK